MKTKYKVFIGMFLIFFIAILYNTGIAQTIQPIAQNGVLDLTNWNFGKDGLVKLDGEWEYYGGRLLEPSDFSVDSAKVSKEYIKVPSSWKGTGSGTYRLKVKLNDSTVNYGIKTTSIRMASKIFVNGIYAGSNGSVSQNNDSNYKSNNIPVITFFQRQGDTAEIIMQVSNYDFFNGGIVQSVYFGKQEDIISLRDWLTFVDILSISFLTITSLYYVAIYMGMRKDKSLLIFGLYALIFAFIISTSNEKVLMNIFSHFSYITALKLKEIGVSLDVILICLFFREKAGFVVQKWFLKTILYIFSLSIILAVFLPIKTYSYIDNIFFLIGVLAHLMIAVFIIVSIWKKNYGPLGPSGDYILLTGIVFIIMHFISAVLYVNSTIRDTSFGSLSLLIFLITISMILSKQYGKAFRTIENISEELIKSDKQKDEFLINTSHELKTPLHGIINITQSVLDESDGKISHKQKQSLNYTVTIAKRLSSLINDIIDFQSLKNNSLKIDLRVFDINGPIQVVAEVMKYLFKGKDLEIINTIPRDTFYIKADENRFKQIIYNLVGNALKFSEKGNVKISAAIVEQFVKISVEDTGTGIDEDKQSKIFEAYEYYNRENSDEYRSSGLGLPISKHLAEYMGGTLWLEWSEKGKGSRFSFTMPYVDYKEEYEISETASYSNNEKFDSQETEFKDNTKVTNSQGPKILLVDDEVSNIKVLTDILGADGYKTLTAFNGKQALQTLKENSDLSLILLDVMMPDISGFEVCKKIREKYSLFEIPILMLTVRNSPDDIATALNIGANDFLEKPFDSKELRARVETLVNLFASAKKAKESEIAFLQAQVKPHFLFNALNSIAALCRKNPSEAEKLTLDFAEYLRSSFDFKNLEELTTINKEINHIKHYLNIEKVRFGKRLEVEYDIEEGYNILIPPLILQPLVENAVKHGISSISSGGKVIVSIKKCDKGILFVVSDNGKGMKKDKINSILSGDAKDGSVGLTNINKRLKTLYGVYLIIESEEGKGTTVSFTLPNDYNKISE